MKRPDIFLFRTATLEQLFELARQINLEMDFIAGADEELPYCEKTVFPVYLISFEKSRMPENGSPASVEYRILILSGGNNKPGKMIAGGIERFAERYQFDSALTSEKGYMMLDIKGNPGKVDIPVPEMLCDFLKEDLEVKCTERS